MVKAIAEFAAIDHLPGRGDGGDAPVVVADQVDDARLPHCSEHLLAFRNVEPERSLAKDGFAGKRRGDGDLAVGVVRRGDIDEVDGGIGDDIAPVGGGVFPAELSGGGTSGSGVAPADRHHPQVGGQIEKARRLAPSVGMRAPHEAVADEANGEGASGLHPAAFHVRKMLRNATSNASAS